MLDEALYFVLELGLSALLLLLHFTTALLDVGLVLLGGSRLGGQLVTGLKIEVLSGPRLHGGVDSLVFLVHVLPEVGSGFVEVEVEGPWLSGLETTLLLLHLGDESFLESLEVGHGLSSRRLERVREIDFGREVLGGVKILVLSSPGFIDVFLHPGRKFSFLETLFGIALNTLLSFVLTYFDHLLELGHEDLPGDDSGAELLQHLRSDIFGKCSISLPLNVLLIEAEGLLGSLGLCH